jgi:hypothetical protein
MTCDSQMFIFIFFYYYLIYLFWLIVFFNLLFYYFVSFNFCIKFDPHSFNCYFLFIIFLIEFYFQFHPLTFDFYLFLRQIRLIVIYFVLDPFCNVLFFFSISSLNILWLRILLHSFDGLPSMVLVLSSSQRSWVLDINTFWLRSFFKFFLNFIFYNIIIQCLIYWILVFVLFLFFFFVYSVIPNIPCLRLND